MIHVLPRNQLEFWYLIIQRWAMPVVVLVLALIITMATASSPDWTEVRASVGLSGGVFGALQWAIKTRWIEIRSPRLEERRAKEMANV